VKIGMLFAIPPEIDVEALPISALSKPLARTLQRYGLYVRDQAGGTSGDRNRTWRVLAAESTEATAETDAVLNAWRSDLMTLFGKLECVTNNLPDDAADGGVGGGGTYPSALWPPPDPVP
jgi:hypothetical protein